MGNKPGTSMGDAISKVPTTRAEARLAEATRSVQLWDCSTHVGTRIWDAKAGCINKPLLSVVDEILRLKKIICSTRIWDAKAGCINRPLLSAVDEILRLKIIHAVPVDSTAHPCMESALGTVMSHLMEEFLLLRIWDASQLEEMISLASAGVSLPFHFGVSTSAGSTTGEFSLCTSNTSGGSHWSRSDVLNVFPEGKFLDQFDLICRATLPVLHEIALRVIQVGSEEELLRTFTRARCVVLDRFLSILEWWINTEVLMKRWIAVTKLIGKVFVAMRRQLYAQNSGAFDGFREEYLMAIAEKTISILLRFADGFTIISSYEKLIYILEGYEALNSAAPNLLFLFSGARKELISQKIQGVLTMLADLLKNMISGLITKIQSYRPNTPSATDGVGVHPLARYAMSWLGQLATYSYSTALDLIPYNGGGHGPGVPAGGAERVTRIGRLMLELTDLLERRLDKLALVCADAGGSPDLFLVNNLSFLLEYARDADLASLLGQEWDQRLGSRLEGLVERYVEAYWAPVVACLDTSVGGSPAKVLEKFNAAFKGAYQSQVCCKVWDPTQREALRKAMKKMVVPAYMAFLQKHPKLGKSISYTSDDVAESLSALFEGQWLSG